MQLSSSVAAYRRVREAILRVELAPGTEISEAQLVERYGFSKAAVRAALARLRADGLVAAQARRGHVITPLTTRDVREIYDLRLLLEPPGAAAAAGRLPAERLAELRALCDPVPDLEDDASAERFLLANRAIHVSIAAAGGNRRCAAIVAQLLDDSERARLIALRGGAAEHGLRVRAEHRDLLTAIEDGDARKASRLMTAAIQAFREEIMTALRTATLDVPLHAASATP